MRAFLQNCNESTHSKEMVAMYHTKKTEGIATLRLKKE